MELKDFKFTLNVSTRYHEWMRARYERLSSSVKFVSIVGAALAFMGVFAPDRWFALIGWAAAAVAFVNIMDLVFGLDQKGRSETELYRRFKELQAEVARTVSPSPEQVASWEATAQVIRMDEMPTFWALYSEAWNQSIDRERREPTAARRITHMQAVLGWVFRYLPKDFPEVGSKPATK
jgi:hypothetical protein